MSSAEPAELRNPPGYDVDLALLQAFERGLDPQHPERSALPAAILGYGEISTVFAIEAPGLSTLACKRLPIFRSWPEITRYRDAYAGYNRLLVEDVGLNLPPYGYAYFSGPDGRPVFYILQERLPVDAIANRALQSLPPAQVLALFTSVLAELRKVWAFNAGQTRVQAGIDGQMSNWVIMGGLPGAVSPGMTGGRAEALAGRLPLQYVDTSTPLFRLEGREQIDPELFLRSAPTFLAWLLRWLFLKDVVNRYYDLHLVTVDLIANFYKEQLPDLIPELVAAANAFLAAPGSGLSAGVGAAPITVAEVRGYYREDRLIWSSYLAMRRLDRALHTRLWRRRYPYILPGPIKR